ncbi:MAG TPA: ABC transporter substrate-binding protein [Lunatimonas sp.]|nr:ABC transporter substrate-binding protein [Lunatimonas sp.]
MKTIAILLLFLLCIPEWGFSQEGAENYKQAIQLIEREEYKVAMDLLRPYMDDQLYGDLAGYAKYHFGRAAMGNSQPELAKTILQPLIDRGTKDQKEKASFLLALIDFGQNKYSEALTAVGRIESQSLKMEAYKATYSFLKFAPTSVLMVQLDPFEDNYGLVLALREKLAAQPSLSSAESRVYERIKLVAPPNIEGETKEVFALKEENQSLDIALILPFNYSGSASVASLPASNFVFELYRGILHAVNEAKRNGIKVDLRTFDTERKPEEIEKIFNDPFFSKADVIIGPIYPEEIEVVATFASERKIPFVNPLSNINEGLTLMDEAFLFRPSTISLAKSAVNYLKRFQGKRVALAYSGTTRDELLAKNFETFSRMEGITIVKSQKVASKDMRSFFDQVGLSNGNSSSKADIVVIFSDDPNIASPTFSLVESLSSSVPIIVMDSWLYFNFASYEMMEAQDFHFISNNTPNLSSPSVEDFRGSYFEYFKTFPGLNSYLGYELIHWILSVANTEKGFDFKENIQKSNYMDGVLTFGFDFSEASYNNFVPILRLEEGAIVIE